MMIDRRSFLAGATALALPTQARSTETERGRSVTDFGVEPNAERYQQDSLRKAIAEINAAGQPAYIPAGTYYINDLKLPPKCILNGDPGRTILLPKRYGSVFIASKNSSLQISGIIFDGRAGKDSVQDMIMPLGLVTDGVLVVRECEFRNALCGAISTLNVSAILTLNNFHDLNHGALSFNAARSVLIRQCHFEDCGSTDTDPRGCIYADGQDVQIADNFIFHCSAGIRVKGNGEIKGNTISGPGAWGIKLGGGNDDAQTLLVNRNTISGCDVGIGLTQGAEILSIMKNTVTAASQGAIRAFDGATATGPDLALESAGTYPNLSLSGNLVR